MKIAYDYQIFCQQPYGGISRYFSNLISWLVEIGEDAKIFSPIHCNEYIKSYPGSVVAGRYYEKYPPKTMRLIKAYNSALSKHQIRSWKPDLLHETYYSGSSLAPKNCPIVTTVYDMIHEIYADKLTNAQKTTDEKLASVNRADHVICISENTKKDLIEIFNVPPQKISVILLGFDQFSRPTEMVTSTTSQYKPYLLYVGSRTGYKNFNMLIDAIASSKSLMAEMNIVCFGGGAFNKLELTHFERLGFKEGQIHQVSGDDELLGSFYRGADAFVYPSLYEGFGIPPLEAMENDCPVICSNASSLPEVVGDAGKYFDPNSIDDIRGSIECVVYSESLRDSLKVLGKNRLKNFSWEKCAKQTLAVYKSLDC